MQIICYHEILTIAGGRRLALGIAPGIRNCFVWRRDVPIDILELEGNLIVLVARQQLQYAKSCSGRQFLILVPRTSRFPGETALESAHGVSRIILQLGAKVGFVVFSSIARYSSQHALVARLVRWHEPISSCTLTLALVDSLL